MRTLRFSTALGVAAVLLAACGPHSGTAPAPSSATTAIAPTAGSSALTPQLIARGDSLYHAATCTECHGRNAKGSPHGPDLTSGSWAQTDGTYEQIVKVITSGVPIDKVTDPNLPEPMPIRGGTKPPLTDEQIRSIAAYVYSLSHR